MKITYAPRFDAIAQGSLMYAGSACPRPRSSGCSLAPHTKLVDGTCNVEVGPWAATARVDKPTVLDVPGGETSCLDRVAHRRQIAVRRVGRFDAPAIGDDRL